MNYSKPTRNEIDKYMNAVRKNMQAAPEEEVDEVILHLQEQIDVALEESGGESDDPNKVRGILSAMAAPDSFASSNNVQAKAGKCEIIAVVSAALSLLFNLGLVPWFDQAAIVWILLVVIALVAGLISSKTKMGKVAIVLLILELVTFPVIHGMGMAAG